MTVVLAVESATDAAGVALADEGGLLAELRVGRGRRHAETIAPGIDTVCRLAGVTLRDVDAVAVDVGPGLFTGLRVGIATVKGIASALALPVVPVTSLDVLAAAVAAACPGTGAPRSVVAVVDARRGEVFWSRYRLPAVPGGGAPAATGRGVPAAGVPGAEPGAGVPGGGPAAWAPGAGPAAWVPWPAPPERISEPVSCAPAVLAAELAGLVEAEPSPPVLVGDGAVRYAAELAVPGVVLADPVLAHPSVSVLAAVGVRRAATGSAVDAATVDALYVRDADARINWERRRPPRPAAGAAEDDGAGGALAPSRGERRPAAPHGPPGGAAGRAGS